MILITSEMGRTIIFYGLKRSGKPDLTQSNIRKDNKNLKITSTDISNKGGEMLTAKTHMYYTASEQPIKQNF